MSDSEMKKDEIITKVANSLNETDQNKTETQKPKKKYTMSPAKIAQMEHARKRHTQIAQERREILENLKIEKEKEERRKELHGFIFDTVKEYFEKQKQEKPAEVTPSIAKPIATNTKRMQAEDYLYSLLKGK